MPDLAVFNGSPACLVWFECKDECRPCFSLLSSRGYCTVYLFYLPCDPKPGNRCDICHPTLSIQFHNNCSITAHNLQAALRQLHFLLSHLFIFLSTLFAYPWREKMQVCYPLSCGRERDSHFGHSCLRDPCI